MFFPITMDYALAVVVLMVLLVFQVNCFAGKDSYSYIDYMIIASCYPLFSGCLLLDFGICFGEKVCQHFVKMSYSWCQMVAF